MTNGGRATASLNLRAEQRERELWLVHIYADKLIGLYIYSYIGSMRRILFLLCLIFMCTFAQEIRQTILLPV